MKCREFGCLGEIMKEHISLPMRWGKRFAYGYPCGNCGRLHWHNGQLVYDGPGEAVFMEDGKIIIEEEDSHDEMEESQTCVYEEEVEEKIRGTFLEEALEAIKNRRSTRADTEALENDTVIGYLNEYEEALYFLFRYFSQEESCESLYFELGLSPSLLVSEVLYEKKILAQTLLFQSIVNRFVFEDEDVYIAIRRKNNANAIVVVREQHNIPILYSLN